MKVWTAWWKIVAELRPAFSREKSFHWFALCLAAMCCRIDTVGVTSFVRTLGLRSSTYERMLDVFHSKAICLNLLTKLWVKIVLNYYPGIIVVNNRIILAADGIKKQKSGKKMPSVKLLHQESESNTKAEYIMGHSCQAIGVLIKSLNSVFCLPLVSRIHEGIIESNRDKRTLMDKLINMIQPLEISISFYLVADAYYGNKKIIEGVLKNGNHLVCRARSNSVGYLEPPLKTGKKGRPKKYGEKIKISDLWQLEKDHVIIAESPVYGERNVQIKYVSRQLIVGFCKHPVLYVLVDNPNRGKIMLMTTDLTMDPMDVIKVYGLRFKIEVAFKQAVWTLGTYSYRFWMKKMKPTKRREGDRYIHKEIEEYRNAIHRKIRAYHIHIQMGTIAQGILQLISATESTSVWSGFGSWLRTVRPGLCPSEKVTAVSMRNELPEFLATTGSGENFKKFLQDRLDLDRAEGVLMVS